MHTPDHPSPRDSLEAGLIKFYLVVFSLAFTYSHGRFLCQSLSSRVVLITGPNKALTKRLVPPEPSHLSTSAVCLLRFLQIIASLAIEHWTYHGRADTWLRKEPSYQAVQLLCFLQALVLSFSPNVSFSCSLSLSTICPKFDLSHLAYLEVDDGALLVLSCTRGGTVLSFCSQWSAAVPPSL